VAFVIDEWRKVLGVYYRVGYVTRDMQIVVCKTDNERPTIEPIEDVCVEAGKKVDVTIKATDPDGHPVKLEAYGGPFEVNNTATFTPNPANFQPLLPASLNFKWTTNCSNVRERPYEVQFKATDQPPQGPKLVEFETFQITVVGPAPKGLDTEVRAGREMFLTWDTYSCSEAESIEIWRKVGSVDLDIDDCEVGMPPNTGYQMIDKVDISTTQYLDKNKGKGLSPGSKYCYRLVAKYPLPGGGSSYVSAESCDSLLIDVPVITNVDVLSTSETTGQIDVKWTPPYQINGVAYPPAYSYDILRKSNAQGSVFTTILAKTSDTSFVDTNLNTKQLQYSYRIVLFDNTNKLVDTSASASSTWLNLRPLVQAIELMWSADVPWSLRTAKYPYHYIYRDRVEPTDQTKLVLIDSVEVTNSAFSYLDLGAFNATPLMDSLEYCYYVSTNGTYDNALLPEPLINRTQIACAQPNDTIPPCTPPSLVIDPNSSCEALLAGRSCDYSSFYNKINWEATTDPDCDDDVKFYNIYYSPSGLENTFVLIGTSVATTFTDYNSRSFKGCYKVAAVDRSNNLSEFTEMICNDNCPNISFPNAFSPNGDGVNDVYTPKYSGGQIQVANFNFDNCPRFILDIEFKVFDRSGNEIYKYSTREGGENDVLIRWDGKSSQGLELGAGVYFYEATVYFDVMNQKDAKKVYKGWIQLMK
jgi:hypothetical protein